MATAQRFIIVHASLLINSTMGFPLITEMTAPMTKNQSKIRVATFFFSPLGLGQKFNDARILWCFTA
jgi:hypothetical protein